MGVTVTARETTGFTAEVVAEQLEVSIAAVYGWLRKGWLGGYKLGGVWRITQHDLDVFLSASRRAVEERGEQIEH